jgi:hypothetical protein
MIDLPLNDLIKYKQLEEYAACFAKWLDDDGLPVGTAMHYLINLVSVQGKMIKILATARGGTFDERG